MTLLHPFPLKGKVQVSLEDDGFDSGKSYMDVEMDFDWYWVTQWKRARQEVRYRVVTPVESFLRTPIQG